METPFFEIGAARERTNALTEKEQTLLQSNNPHAEHSPLTRIRVYTAATALDHAGREQFYNHHFYYFQSGFLLLHRILHVEHESYYGGLDGQQALFVLVPVDLVRQRKRNSLMHIARNRLGGDNQEQLVAFCERAEQEPSSKWGHYPTPAFQAETQACEVGFWLDQVKPWQLLPSADWKW